MRSHGSMIARNVQNRVRRLSMEVPKYNSRIKVTNESAITALLPLTDGKIDSNSFDFALHVLESVTNKSTSRKVAKFIAHEIALGLDPNVNISLEKYDIPEESRAIVEEAVSEAAVCQRIINNQNMLNKRFNTDEIVRENKYNTDKIISELCELIDTYNVPAHYKYNVALENIVYILSKNHVEVPSDDYLANAITEYFLFRDEEISDNVYQAYQDVLRENSVLTLSDPTDLVESFLEASGTHYTDQTNSLFECMDDQFIKESFEKAFNSIKVEADAADYIDEMDAYFESDEDITTKDKGIMIFTLKNLPNCKAGTSRDFVNIKAKQTLGDDIFDGIDSPESIISSSKPINEKPDPFNYTSFYENLFSESDDFKYASTDNIPKVIEKFKAEQDKSPNKVAAFIRKLHTKSPESVIDGMPNIMGLTRGCILICVAGATPIGPIIAAILGLVSWLISKDINEKDAKRLKTCIVNEKEKVQKKMDKASGKSKDELKKYYDDLEACEKKVQDYLETLANDNEEKDDSSDDDDDFDFGDDDFEFESAQGIVDVANFLSICERVADQSTIKFNMQLMFEAANATGVVFDLSDICNAASVCQDTCAKAINKTISESSQIDVIRPLLEARENLSTSNVKISSPKDVVAMEIANDTLIEAAEIVNEKVNLNTLKLALQNGKAKLKDLSMKEKSMWQSADAQASGMMKGIEKAMTSDRREAIIKGNIIPSFSKLCKSAIALSGIGIVFGPATAAVAALGALGVSGALNAREKKLLMDEIDTELKVVEKQIEIAQNDGDMNQYRFLLNYQKKLTREYQRIRYGLKVSGRDIPSATIPGQGGRD
nr:MAG TPA: hypothetical protein [Caudoviricetes sp.]